MSDRSGRPSEWVETGRSLHADCKVFAVERRTFQHAGDARIGDFFVIRPQPWAVAMARTPEGDWVLVRQFRFGTQTMAWEFPSGCANPDEDLVSAAVRELREETGFVGVDPVLLGMVEPNPALQDNPCAFVFVKDAQCLAATEWDPHEELQVERVSDPELRRRIRSGEMTHALMLAGLALWDAVGSV